MRIVSSYILREFIAYLFYCILAFIAIYILVDTVEHIDNFIDSGLQIKLVLLYYALYLPFIIVLTMPVAMLIATMFSLGRLVGDNEITAMKASGISIYRILLPSYVFALFTGLVTMVFSEIVVPRTNLYREDIMEFVKLKKFEQDDAMKFSFSKNRELDRHNVYLANSDGRIINALVYRSLHKKAEKVLLLEPLKPAVSGNDSHVVSARFRSRIDADSLTFSNGTWFLHNVTERIFEEDGEKQTNYKLLDASFITLKPSDFARLDVEPEEMNFFELSRYIDQINSSGGDASEWLVDLYIKIAFPFVSFVIVFFGAPLAASSTGRGKTASFGIALVIIFAYYAFINAFQILGRNGAVEPLAAAWIPNGVFFVLGFDLHLRAKK